MNKITRRSLGAVILLLAVLLSPLAGVYSASASGAQKTYETPMPETSLLGTNAYAQQFFQVPEYWKVSGASFRLDYQVSQLTLNDMSVVTLKLNGNPFYTIRPGTGSGKVSRNIGIPLEYLKSGVNELTIEGTIQTKVKENQICAPIEERGSWLQIFDSSGINVNYDLKPVGASIRDFNRHFTGMDTMQDGLAAVFVAEEGDLNEMEAAVYALSGLTGSNASNTTVIPLLPYSAENANNKPLGVLVGLAQHLPADIRAKLNKASLQDQALIQLIQSGSASLLVVTSDNEELLKKAGRFVGNAALMEQLASSSKLVDKTTDVDTPALSISRYFPLTGSGDTVTGPSHREKNYFISLPSNRSVAEASKLSLDFRYATNLDFNRSMVTVLVNNVPIGSKKLSAERAGGDNLELTIPKNLGISGNFTITTAFDLELQNTLCTGNEQQMPWAFVSPDSMLQLNTKDRTDMLFNNYPYPFLRDGSYNRVAVVLPQTQDNYTYAAVSNLFNLMGQYAASNTGEIRFYTDKVAESELKDRQIIAIGSYANNRYIRDNNNKLYFQYDKTGEGFLSNEKISIEEGYGKRIGTLQLIDSPYGKGHGFLAVTGSSSEYAYLASKLLGQAGNLYKIYGDGAMIDKDGQIHAYRFKKEAEPEAPPVLTQVIDRSDVVTFIIAIMLVLVLVLVSLVFLVRKHRNRKKRRR
ncbi:cellulose biosynthesis cyclic di-GMP-binding regulatory protein BcsB [Paenibacillus glycanilyticus]|uniref:Glycosyl transferase n=1 Tax=Paenibacillus glycanilyticus TaxID=126569 RepID=A0ABQ6GM05_9BACL|nr:cellulose biosynthesis cyclic di-GMP-binding regulatory protein BcsB [Paenibacillus glycanilyticus]GLX70383.1 glycosyl transferase [Paenibacillus glycanilyticus]